MPKVALHLREQDLSAEVFDFQTCRDGLSDEFVVRFDFFIRCFYQYFSMLVSEAHKGLGLAGHFADRQSAFVQCLSHIQEDNGVYYIAEYLSPDSIDTPLFEGQAFLLYLCCKDFFIVSLLQRTNMKTLKFIIMQPQL